MPSIHRPSDRWDETRRIAICVPSSPFVSHGDSAVAGASEGARAIACSTSLHTLGSRTFSLTSGCAMMTAAKTGAAIQTVMAILYHTAVERGKKRVGNHEFATGTEMQDASDQSPLEIGELHAILAVVQDLQ